MRSFECPVCGKALTPAAGDMGAWCDHCGRTYERPEKPEDGKPKEVSTTGAKRDNWYPKGAKFPARYDLMFRNDVGMRRLAETWGEGFAKYGPDNWMKGFPESVLISHALDHILKHLSGDKSEDHLPHACWNLLMICWIEENKPELIDLTKPECQ